MKREATVAIFTADVPATADPVEAALERCNTARSFLLATFPPPAGLALINHVHDGREPCRASAALEVHCDGRTGDAVEYAVQAAVLMNVANLKQQLSEAYFRCDAAKVPRAVSEAADWSACCRRPVETSKT